MYSYDRRTAGHSGEVDLTSPVEGKAILVIDGADVDSINYAIPAGGVPKKWVDRFVEETFGRGATYKALQSKYPRTTKTLQVNSTKYRVEHGDEKTTIEVELSVKKKSESPSKKGYDRRVAVVIPSDFQKAKDLRDRLEAEADRAGRALKALSGGGAFGMTPDLVRATPEWKKAKQESDAAFTELQKFNTVFVRRFKKEIAEERRR